MSVRWGNDRSQFLRRIQTTHHVAKESTPLPWLQAILIIDWEDGDLMEGEDILSEDPNRQHCPCG
eukprot:m.40871 g.40871  ORF g.40871 m.40871 type:complete len:65 (+) comp14033_c0_seq2:289-483(+)